MGETKFTPGPWTFEGRTIYALEEAGWRRGEPVMRNRFDCSVQGPFCPDAEKQANAHLIAAAPDLYDALDYLLNDDTHDAREQARAALAKARGEA